MHVIQGDLAERDAGLLPRFPRRKIFHEVDDFRNRVLGFRADAAQCLDAAVTHDRLAVAQELSQNGYGVFDDFVFRFFIASEDESQRNGAVDSHADVHRFARRMLAQPVENYRHGLIGAVRTEFHHRPDGVFAFTLIFGWDLTDPILQRSARDH